MPLGDSGNTVANRPRGLGSHTGMYRNNRRLRRHNPCLQPHPHPNAYSDSYPNTDPDAHSDSDAYPYTHVRCD